LRVTSSSLDVNKHLFYFSLSPMTIKTEIYYLDKFSAIMQNNNINMIIESLKSLKNDSSLTEYEDTKTLELLILQMKV